MFTRRHYDAIAGVLADVKALEGMDSKYHALIALRLSQLFEGDNVNFKPDYFIAASNSIDGGEMTKLNVVVERVTRHRTLVKISVPEVFTVEQARRRAEICASESRTTAWARVADPIYKTVE